MIFFSKSWSQDCGLVNLAGILLGIAAVYIWPLPLLKPAGGVVPMLLFAIFCAALTTVWVLWMLTLANPEGKLKDKIGVSLPDRKCMLHTVSFLPVLLAGVAAVTWHWKYTLRKLDIPFEEQQMLLKMISFDSVLQVSLMLILVVVIVPVLEELIFRRILFDLFARSIGFNGAAFVSAGVFSAAHNFSAGAPGLFLMGLAFQWVYSRNQNLVCAAVLHSLCNLFAVTVMIVSKL